MGDCYEEEKERNRIAEKGQELLEILDNFKGVGVSEAILNKEKELRGTITLWMYEHGALQVSGD